MPEVQRGDGSASILLKRAADRAVGDPVLVPGVPGRVWPENPFYPEILPSLQKLHSSFLLPLDRDQSFFDPSRSKSYGSLRLSAVQHPLSVLPFAWYSLSDCTNPLTTTPLHLICFGIVVRWRLGKDNWCVTAAVPELFSENALKYISILKTLNKLEHPPCFCPIPWRLNY